MVNNSFISPAKSKIILVNKLLLIISITNPTLLVHVIYELKKYKKCKQNKYFLSKLQRKLVRMLTIINEISIQNTNVLKIYHWSSGIKRAVLYNE